MTASARTEQPETARDSAAAGDSIAVAAWTLVSRIAGVVKIAAIGAVLGLTFFGNAYQFTNSLPNLIYFGLLAGSLFSSLLVPALVEHIDAGDRAATERVAGGFMGVALLALVAAVPLAIAFGPTVLGLAAGGASTDAAAQEQVGRWLILMFIPQLFLYGVIGAATAAMNARRRFALAAAAPALESLGTIAVLVACAVMYGTSTRVDAVPDGELLLLGLGTTGAVALHALAQWWGAKRAGIRLIPRAGWRDAEVRMVVRRALPSMAQAGLVALQVMTLLVLATEECPFGDDGGNGWSDKLHAWMAETPEENRAEVDQMTAAKAFIMGRNMFSPVRDEWDRQWERLVGRQSAIPCPGLRAHPPRAIRSRWKAAPRTTSSPTESNPH